MIRKTIYISFVLLLTNIDVHSMLLAKEQPSILTLTANDVFYPVSLLNAIQQWQKALTHIVNNQPSQAPRILFQDCTHQWTKRTIEHLLKHTNSYLIEPAYNELCDHDPAKRGANLKALFAKAQKYIEANKTTVILNLDHVFIYDYVTNREENEIFFKVLYECLEHYQSPYLMIVASAQWCPEMLTERYKKYFTTVMDEPATDVMKRNYLKYGLATADYKKEKDALDNFCKKNAEEIKKYVAKYGCFIINRIETKELLAILERIDMKFMSIDKDGYDKNSIDQINGLLQEAIDYLHKHFNCYFFEYWFESDPCINETYIKSVAGLIAAMRFSVDKYRYRFGETHAMHNKEIIVALCKEAQNLSFFALNELIEILNERPKDVKHNDNYFYRPSYRSIDKDIAEAKRRIPFPIQLDRFRDLVREENNRQELKRIERNKNITKTIISIALLGSFIKIYCDEYRKDKEKLKKKKEKLKQLLENQMAFVTE